MKVISRVRALTSIKTAFEVHPIVALLGPRQCGKSTLAHAYCKTQPAFSAENYFDLESILDTQRLSNPELTLSSLTGLVVIDEIQRSPDIFPVLRYLVDTQPDLRFLILGSASHHLIQQSSESLAGRIGYLGQEAL